jgi:hypothetical protein
VLVLFFTPKKRKLPKQHKNLQLEGDGGGVREQELADRRIVEIIATSSNRQRRRNDK